MQPRIVCIEDEPDILEFLSYNLKREGFEVGTASDGESGLDRVRRGGADLVLLDLLLPGVDGLEICRRLKADAATRDIPIIMVSAKGEESDVVRGLGLGADDYVTKPFSPRELIARIRTVLRRVNASTQEDSSERLVRGDLVINRERHEVRLDKQLISLTATEFRLLHLLASHPGRVFTREQIVDRAIGDDAIVIDRNIDVHVRSIRKKLGSFRDVIETIRSVGYRFHDTQEDS